MTTIAVFASSLVFALILLVLKAVELRFNKKNFILRLLSRLDSRAEKTLSSLKFRALQIVQSFRYIVIVELRLAFQNWLFEMREKAIREYKVRESVIMGQKNIANKGSVSFFLKKIDEGKRGGQRGEIF